MKAETFDAARYLGDDRCRIAYLNEWAVDGTPPEMAGAVMAVVRSIYQATVDEEVPDAIKELLNDLK